MCTYTYAPALRGTRQHGGWKGGNSPPPPLPPSSLSTGFRPPVTCSPLILFSLTVPVVSPSLCRVRPLLASYSLFFPLPSLSLNSLVSSPHPSHSPCPSSLPPSFVTMRLVSPAAAAPIYCCCDVTVDETSRRTRYLQKKGMQVCRTRTRIFVLIQDTH